MTSRKPEKIPPRKQTTNGKNGGKSSTSKSGHEFVIRRRAWYLKTCVSCEMTEDNMEKMRKELSTCQAVKTTLKLTHASISWGGRGLRHRIKRRKEPLEHVTSLEQDDIFVNMLMCVFELSDMPGEIRYEITAFKFHDPADVRAFAGAFQALTGVGPIEKAPSIVNGSVLVRSVAGGSMHSLAMPGRPTNVALAPDRWVAVDRTSVKRFLSTSTSNLTAPSEVFYSNGTMTRNGAMMQGGGTHRVYHANGNYRSNRGTTDMTSDEGNGSLSLSDHAHQRHVMCSDVETSIAEPVDSDLQPVFNYQRYRAHVLNHQSVADIACQVVIPNGVDMRPYTSGAAVAMTGSGGSGGGGSTRMTRSSGIGRESRDFDDMSDDLSTMSEMSSTFNEPRLTTRDRTDGIAIAYVNGNRGQHRQFNGIFDEVDEGYTARRMASPSSNGVPHMSSAVHRVYSRPVRSGSEISLTRDGEYATSRRSRYQSTDGYLHSHGAAVRSRSAGPIQARYARSDLGLGGPVVDNSDAISVAASTYSLRQASVYIDPRFEKRYVTRQNNSIYRQAPRPVHVSTSSGYGGARSRTMSHRMP